VAYLTPDAPEASGDRVLAEAAKAPDGEWTRIIVHAYRGDIDQAVKLSREDHFGNAADVYDLVAYDALWRGNDATVRELLPELKRQLAQVPADEEEFYAGIAWTYERVIGLTDAEVPPGVPVQQRSIAHASVAVSLIRRGDNEGAQKQLDIAAAVTPFADFPVTYDLAIAYAQLGDFEKAAQFADELEPEERAMALVYAAVAHQRRGEADQGETLLAEARALHDSYSVDAALGFAFTGQEIPDDASPWFIVGIAERMVDEAVLANQ
ncbi:MAG: hypothetical protein AAF656_12160, partial [Planctomycetota bacterium]